MGTITSRNAKTGVVSSRAETPAEIAAREAAAAVAAAERAKTDTATARLRVLAIKAAKYARDPAGNPALTTRETHEAIARLALAAAADDQ